MAARGWSVSGVSLRCAPVRWSFVSGMVITGDADADIARRTTGSATNDLMLRERDRGYAVSELLKVRLL